MTQQYPSETPLDRVVQLKFGVIAQAELDLAYKVFADGLPEINLADPEYSGQKAAERMDDFVDWVGGMSFTAQGIGELVALKQGQGLESEGSLTFDELVPYVNAWRIGITPELRIEAIVSDFRIDLMWRRA